MGSAAASSKLSPAGIGSQQPAGMAISSAKVPMTVLAGDTHAFAEGLLTAQAFGAAAAERRRGRAIRARPGTSPLPGGAEITSPVPSPKSHHQWQGVSDALASAAHVEVHAVQRRGAQAHQRLARGGDRIREVADSGVARHLILQQSAISSSMA